MNLKFTLLLSMITFGLSATDIVLDPTKDTPSNRFLLAQGSTIVMPIETVLEFMIDISELDPEDRCICIEICDCQEDDLLCTE